MILPLRVKKTWTFSLAAHHAYGRVEAALGQHHLLLPDDLAVAGEEDLDLLALLDLGVPPLLLLATVRLILLRIVLHQPVVQHCSPALLTSTHTRTRTSTAHQHQHQYCSPALLASTSTSTRTH